MRRSAALRCLRSPCSAEACNVHDRHRGRERQSKIRTLAVLRHKFIVEFVGVCFRPPDLLLITELCPCSLHELLHARHESQAARARAQDTTLAATDDGNCALYALPLGLAIRLALQVCEGMEYLGARVYPPRSEACKRLARRTSPARAMPR